MKDRMQRPNTTTSRPRTTTGRERKVTLISVRGVARSESEVNINKKKLSDVRLQRVISEINEFQTRSTDHLRKDATKKAKELLWFFSLFTVYVMFGIFLFFYIEECSGAARPNDDSVLLKDEIAFPEIKNSTKNCLNIYKSFIVSKSVNNITSESDVSVEDFANTSFSFANFLKGCEEILKKGLKPVVIKEAKIPECVVTEYKLLKYAEFVVFTLLLIGYGNTTPQTIAGRYTIIAYAIIGIPLGLTMYSVAGKLLVQLITFLVRKFESIVLKNKVEVRYLYVKTVVVGIFFLFLLMMTGSFVTTSSNMENLDLTSSIYFWFVTWSTIGYGDITFQRNQHLRSPHLMIVAVFNLLFGLGMYVAIIEALSTSIVNQDENNNNMDADTFIVDGNGNVKEEYQQGSDDANTTTSTQLSDQQQLRIQEALKKYQKIKDSCPSQLQSPVVFSTRDIRRGSFVFADERKSVVHSTSSQRKMKEEEDAVRPFSSLSFARNNKCFEYATTDV